MLEGRHGEQPWQTAMDGNHLFLIIRLSGDLARLRRAESRGVPSANFLPSSECRVLRLCSGESEFWAEYLHVLNDQR